MQERAARTREALLDAVAEIVDARGYDGASLADVLARAGVTKGAMYHHFPSKAALVGALVEEQFAPILASPTIPGMPVLHAAEITLQALAATVDDVRFRAAFGVVVDRPHPELAPWSRPVDEWSEVFAAQFAAARDVGDLGDGVDVAAEGEAVVATTIGCFCMARAAGVPGRAVEAVATAWGMVVDRAVVAGRRAAHRRALTELVGAYQR
ncbi:TetR family transcriptional regulator [Tsukamurella hominis]|uniref:TetR family transcriptional regulator n=1 Tax=Tsukamurella hominis TaxID=1970232 RepID=UPI0039E7DABD